MHTEREYGVDDYTQPLYLCHVRSYTRTENIHVNETRESTTHVVLVGSGEANVMFVRQGGFLDKLRTVSCLWTLVDSLDAFWFDTSAPFQFCLRSLMAEAVCSSV